MVAYGETVRCLVSDDVVTPFTGSTRHDMPVDRILDEAREFGLEEVVVIGRRPSGEFYLAASSAQADRNYWLLGLAQADLMASSLTEG